MAADPKDSWEPAARRFHEIEKQQKTFVEAITDIVLGVKEPVQDDFALEA